MLCIILIIRIKDVPEYKDIIRIQGVQNTRILLEYNAELEIREKKTEHRKPNPGHDTRFTEFHV